MYLCVFYFQLLSNEDINSTIRSYFCANKTYNDMATLFFNPQEAAIHQLFHQHGEKGAPTQTEKRKNSIMH